MAPPMRFLQGFKRLAVNPAGESVGGSVTGKRRLWKTWTVATSSDGEDGAPALLGMPVVVLATRCVVGIFRRAGIGQRRSHRGDTDASILAVEIGSVTAHIGGFCPVCLGFLLAHVLAPS